MVCTLSSKLPTSSPNPMFDHLLESSNRDDSYKWSMIGFGEQISQVVCLKLILCILTRALGSIITLQRFTTMLLEIGNIIAS